MESDEAAQNDIASGALSIGVQSSQMSRGRTSNATRAATVMRNMQRLRDWVVALIIGDASRRDDDRGVGDTRSYNPELTTALTVPGSGASRGSAWVPRKPRLPPRVRGDGPTIGIITALPEENAALSELIDEPHRIDIAGDGAAYLIGTVPSSLPGCPHRVVLTLLTETGNAAAAQGCAHLMRSFPSLGHILMVGIAAGIPAPLSPDKHVALGDLVISTWGLVDYDHVYEGPDGPRLRQPFPSPSPTLCAAAKTLERKETLGDRPWKALLAEAERRLPDFARPPTHTDPLGSCGDLPRVHYGRIGSADRALRNAAVRDQLAARHDLHAIEMEGKGVGLAAFAAGREWFIVRAISDYGDEHTDRRWRKYASLAAAAYTRALLGECQPTRSHRPSAEA
ncbi:5'-methylthioadenosine/S-adenosylhomocysteine nucleosidase [Nocardia brasiliensis]|uniref:5'-methylthioadenosine/S-adenosylhomocysteine nucleosidase family protein n=1 Tax=Nocardia brasiliensis TaxID=37326 RepID=UPI00245708CC|nr:5'-methylthioadenosine/S-adenosylhomocysteine nucleosidase [Nocardia brasiliensis]